MGCGSSTAVEQASPGVAVPMPVPAVLTLEPLKSSSTRRARKGSVEAELDSMGAFGDNKTMLMCSSCARNKSR